MIDGGAPTVNNPSRVPPPVEAVEPVQEGTPRVIHPIGGAAQRVGSVAAYQEQAMQPLNAFPDQGELYVTIEQDVTLLSTDGKDSISFVAGQKVHKSQAVRFGLVDEYVTVPARVLEERPAVAPTESLDSVPTVVVETQAISFDPEELERLGLVSDPERFKAAVEAGELRQLVAVVATPDAVDWPATLNGGDDVPQDFSWQVNTRITGAPSVEESGHDERSAPGAPQNAAAGGPPQSAAMPAELAAKRSKAAKKAAESDEPESKDE